MVATMHPRASTLAGCVAGLWLIASCGGVTEPTSPAWIRGTLTAIGPDGQGGEQTYLVVAPGGESACLDHQRAQVHLSLATHLSWRTGGRAWRSELRVGQDVSVWITGIVIDLCPPIVRATDLIIETPANAEAPSRERSKEH